MDTPTPPTPIAVDLGRIAQDLQIRRVQVESVVQLLDEGNTVPFITRYRKERTGNLNEVAVREVQLRVGRLRDLADRKETILKAIDAQGKLTDELRDAIRGADNPKRLEDLYLPYKPKKKSKAGDARERGLEPLAVRIWSRDESLTDLEAAAAEYLNPEKGVETVEQVLEGVGHILAESISELAAVRDAARRVVWKTGKMATTKGEVAEGQGLEFRDYFDYSEPIAVIPPHRVLAINRGDKEGPLKVKLDVARPDLERALYQQLPLEGHPQRVIFEKSAIDALDRLLLPSLEREVRRDLTEMAERHAVDVFARNLRSLLLQPPITKQVVLALDPGFRTGCKVAVLDGHGVLIEQTVIHPHAPQNRRHEAKQAIKDLVARHHVGVVAIGNGTACRETEELVAEIIAEGTRFHAAAQAGDPSAVPSSEPAPEAPAAEAPASEAHAAESPAAEAPAESHETPAPVAEIPAETAPAAEAAPEAHEAAPAEVASNGSTAELAAEAMPPIAGGAPDEGEGVPPAAGDSEGNIEEAQALRADVLEHSPETHNPAREVAPAPAAEAPPKPAPAETPIETMPPPAPEEGPPATVEAPISESPAAPVAAHEPPAAAPVAPAEHEAGAAAVEAPISESQAGHAPAEGAEAPAPKPAATLTGPPKGAPPQQQQQQPSKPKGEPRPPRPKQPPPAPKPHVADPLLAKLAYVIVNEAGASIYSTSPVGREEFPEYDATTRGTVSIGRRLQDPLSELVKIEPQSIGVGLYQHDVNPKHLKESLETVIESCVNFVGVDLNTASIPLLRHVSGLNSLTARRIAEHRKEKGPFTDREQLKTVEGVGPATFTQAAGFLKVRESANPLDRTWIHPESYEVAARVLEKLGFTPDIILHRDQLPALHAKLDEANLPELAKELEIGEPTLHDIFEALARPERDPRDDLPKPIFKTGVLKLEDLTAGMELKGTVLNVVDFGAFVDIGLKDSGLVHISQLANRYIKSPHDVVSVGDVVTAWVMGVDGERKRVSLTMVQPGTERPRGGPQERGDRGRRPAQGQGQGPDQGPGPGQGQGQGQGQRPPQGDRRGAGPRPPQGPPREGAPVGAGPGVGRPGGGPGGPPRPGMRPGGPPSRPQGGAFGRGGPRPGQGGQGQNRYGPAPSQNAAPAQPVRPPKPAGPPPPLTKAALTGAVPLRSFGQLKQLWSALESPPRGRPGQPAPRGGCPGRPGPSGADAPGPAPGRAEPRPPARVGPVEQLTTGHPSRGRGRHSPPGRPRAVPPSVSLRGQCPSGPLSPGRGSG